MALRMAVVSDWHVLLILLMPSLTKLPIKVLVAQMIAILQSIHYIVKSINSQTNNAELGC